MLKPGLVVVLTVLAAWTVNLVAGDYRDSEQTVTTLSASQMTSSIPLEELAVRWRLSEQEYTRYLDIINGPLGRWNENIDPVFALGMFAETQAEQRRYAELLAQQEYELALRTIEFERDYRRAFQRLYPNTSMVDDRLLEPYYRKHPKNRLASSPNVPVATQSVFHLGDRVLFFVDPNNCGRCIEDLNKLIELTGYSVGVMIDVYVLNAGNADDVNRWANQTQLDDGLVGNAITLNADNGMYQQIIDAHGKKSGNVFLNRGDQLYRIDTRQLREWKLNQ